MRSLFSKAKDKAAKSMGKRGQVLNTVNSTVFGVMFLIFLVFAVLFAIATLNPSSFFTANSAEANATANLTGSLTEGVAEIGYQIPTLFKVLAVVLILGAIVLLILYIGRMRQVSGQGSNSGL